MSHDDSGVSEEYRGRKNREGGQNKERGKTGHVSDLNLGTGCMRVRDHVLHAWNYIS